ncbi:TPA: TolC family protein [Proteus mirabilis]|nr:TolC family protein [Proteus mirabilis]
MKNKIVFIISLSLVGCSLAPTYTRPPSAADVTETIKEGNSLKKSRLYDLYISDKYLSQVLYNALKNNADIQKSALRIRSAQAQTWRSIADLIPSIDFRTNQTIAMSSQINPFNGEQYKNKTKTFQSSIGLDSYEVDIWGKTLSEINAKNDERVSFEYTAAAVRLSLMADIISNWYETLSMIRIWHILNEKKMLLNSLASGLDTIQQQQRLDPLVFAKFFKGKNSDNESLLNLEKEIVSRIHKIEYLSGFSSPWLNVNKWQSISGEYNVPEFADKISSSVVFERPDVLSSEMNIRVANGNIGAARAAFLPVVNIFSRAYHTSESLDKVIGNLTKNWTLTPTIIFPIFSFPKSWANLEYAKSQQAIAIIEYKDTIANALKDIKDSANSLSVNSQLFVLKSEETEVQKTNYNKLKLRHESGYLDLYSLYESLDIYYTSLVELESNRQQLMDNTIILLKSIGG